MNENIYNGAVFTPSINDEIKDFLNIKLMEHIREISLYQMQLNRPQVEAGQMTVAQVTGNDNVLSTLNDFFWLTNQTFLNTITTPGAVSQIFKLMNIEGKEKTRIDFILKITAELKLHLGREGWTNLLNDLCFAFEPGTVTRENKDKSILSLLNKSTMTLDESVLTANHWLVPIIIYGVDGRTATTIGAEINSIRHVYAEINR